MSTTEIILGQIKEEFPNAAVSLVVNESPSNQNSLLVAANDLFPISKWLRDQPELAFDYLSNVTGVDWLDTVVKEKVTTKELHDGEEVEVETAVEKTVPGYLEVVYHLYSASLRKGPLILRVQTENRSDRVTVPSLTTIWRSAEFQEREVYDLYGVVFEGHPDLRRLLMWDEFEDHPMRKDYVEPDDYEYEPTPHGDILEKSRQAAAPCNPNANGRSSV
ncbi:MAG: NAD(P)H-quinone oxidoreductase subunit J [Verrucomicrobia subdivision 3 bacterium]|nr:NAD(P)H-quinone oxidoreductase subunit J [Limisphaerales bacterium]MCS1414437.1 NAD(P)H-quinone oxidoreductase subunit J [Limisphaerales bacterium]